MCLFARYCLPLTATQADKRGRAPVGGPCYVPVDDVTGTGLPGIGIKPTAFAMAASA